MEVSFAPKMRLPPEARTLQQPVISLSPAFTSSFLSGSALKILNVAMKGVQAPSSHNTMLQGANCIQTKSAFEQHNNAENSRSKAIQESRNQEEEITGKSFLTD